VHSFDHGNFFPGGPNWTTQTLATAPPAQADTRIVGECELTVSEIDAARAMLQNVTSTVIAGAIAPVPTDWGLSEDERLALCDYLHTRWQALRT
jgi:hypothetical protein